MLHLTGVKAVNPKYETLGQSSVTLDDIKRFRQLDSKCPGHPEYRWTSGVETTTGPLGQGVATSVGMAIAERWLASYFNRPGFDLFDYDVYALCGDGCMMEGISGEAASLAGHLKLAQPVLDLRQQPHHDRGQHGAGLQRRRGHALRRVRLERHARGRCQRSGDARARVPDVQETTDRPTLIIVDSHIAYGAPNKQDTSAAHGEPLGAEEIKLAKRHYGWPEDAKFLVPDGVREHFESGIGARGQALQRAWWATFEEYRREYPELADRDTACCDANCRTTGTRGCRYSLRTAKASRRATRRARR